MTNTGRFGIQNINKNPKFQQYRNLGFFLSNENFYLKRKATVKNQQNLNISALKYSLYLLIHIFNTLTLNNLQERSFVLQQK
jgi:hypothetical protein